MLGGGETVKLQCRRPDIMADAAYAVLTSDCQKYTGHFDIDEELLRRHGVTDFQKYSYSEGVIFLRFKLIQVLTFMFMYYKRTAILKV